MASNPPRWGGFPTVRCALYNCTLYIDTAFGRPSGRVGRADRAFSRVAPHALWSWPPQAVPIPRAGAENRGMLTQPPAAGGFPRSPRIAMRIARHQDIKTASLCWPSASRGALAARASFPSDPSRSICTCAFSTTSPCKNCIRLGQVARHKAVVSAPAQALSAPLRLPQANSFFSRRRG